MQNLDSVFSALGDPSRRLMVERLARRPMSVGELSKGLNLSQPGISKHVRVLEEAGLLKREVIGRVHLCTIEPRAVEAASSWIDRQRKFWIETLDRLDSYFAATPKPKRKKGR